MTELNMARNRIKNKKIKRQLNINKYLFLIVLTLITLILLKGNPNLKEQFYKYIFDSNISFASINNLYQKYFGSPIPDDIVLSNTSTVMSETLKYKTKESYKDGVLLEVDNNYLVPSLETGVVIYIGEKEGYGNTVVIEQINGLEVWYSNITTSLNMYDYVEKGTLVGEANQKLYLSFKKDGTFVNYEDYI